MIQRLLGPARRTGLEFWSAAVLLRAGVVRPLSVRQLAGMAKALNAYGLMGGGTTIAALRDPDGVALIDERGPLTFGELDRRSAVFGAAKCVAPA